MSFAQPALVDQREQFETSSISQSYDYTSTPSRMLKNDSQSTGRRVSSGSMRGDDQRQDGMFSYISPDKRVP
ncbi:MAG: hypothetical protein WA555_20260, partial [Candidatus Sulfotelmatobacter sp.]